IAREAPRTIPYNPEAPRQAVQRAILQPILDYLAVANDDVQALAILRQQADVLERIAIDDDEIGECVGLDAAQPPFVHQDFRAPRSEAHTSEIQSLMRISY